VYFLDLDHFALHVAHPQLQVFQLDLVGYGCVGLGDVFGMCGHAAVDWCVRQTLIDIEVEFLNGWRRTLILLMLIL